MSDAENAEAATSGRSVFQPADGAHNTDDAGALSEELRESCALVEGALDELYAPLRDLARANLRATEPPLRALAVLATGVQRNEEPILRERRILLAAALEMLAVALRIHNLLISAAAAPATNGTAGGRTASQPLDRSLAGSTILAGDYCFSRAAVLAAQTDSPTVVAIFSQALKNVSEGRLRTFFNPAASPYGEEIELMHAGVRGAVHLAAIPTSALASALALAEALAARAPFPTASQLSGLTQQQHARWQAAWQIVANHVDTPAND